MKIIRQFEFNGAFYALVELDDGSRVEFKSRQDKAPKEAAILRQAEKYQEAIAKQAADEAKAAEKAAEKAARIVDKKTGADVSKKPVKEFIADLQKSVAAQPAYADWTIGDVLKAGGD